jgi:alcohol dehydrogenase (cytochrome c)
MKTLRSCAAVVLAVAGTAFAQTAQDLASDGKNTDNVLTYGMGYHQNRYSPLAQINKGNVKRLAPAWTLSLENDYGEQGQPLVHNGVMYVTNVKWTVAIDAATGKQLWRTPVEFPPDMVRVVCCGVSNKGPAIYEGRLFRTTLDAHVVALDMKTGKEIWKTKFGEWKESYAGIVQPTIANGVLISGMAGGDRTARGFIDGYDPETGKQLWRRWTVPAPGEPGSETWPNKDFPDAWKYGGAATWQPVSYDPQLDLFYVGTGNAEPYNPKYRGGLDSLYAASVLAIRPKTGEMVWYYQFLPNDSFDFDATAENIVADMQVEGKPRKVLLNVNKNGFVYVIDRTNGKLIAAHPFVNQNWAKHIDLQTGRPVLTDLLDRAIKGETIDLAPRLGTNATLSAYNPRTGMLFLNSWELVRVMKFVDVELKIGQGYTGIETSSKFPKPAGYHIAMNPLTGKVAWKIPLQDLASSAGLLATEGGLVFTGLLTGEFLALDQDTGKRLWQFKTGSSVNAPPITYTHKGVQYVTVLSGRGGSNPTRSAGDIIPAGGSVWTFALMPD